MLRSYYFKLLHSPFLYVGIIGVFGLCLISTNEYLVGADVYVDMHLLLEMEGYRKAFIVFAAIPFASNFADEWNSKAITNCVSRKSTPNYAVTNVLYCYISALLAVFIPLVVFAAVSCLSKPLFAGSNGFPSYGELAEVGLPFLALIFYFLTFSLSCAMWAVMGMTLSAFFPSKYIAIGAPFILSHAIERFTSHLPYQFDLMGLSMSYLDFPWLGALCYTTLIFTGISALCGILFVKTVERRVQNELN